MPRKPKIGNTETATFSTPTITNVQTFDAPTAAAKADDGITYVEPELCGHINRHSGKLNLACVQAKGHAGNHAAFYKRMDSEGKRVQDECSWTDAAGTPPKESDA